MIQSFVDFIRSILGPGDTEYGVGWNAALREVEDHLLERAWDEGEDVE